MRSLLVLIKEQPVLREAAAINALGFATFGMFWTTMVLHLSRPPFNFQSNSIGLFGLAAYMAESRTKEIGIRKVLGASVAGISVLLSSGFIRLVLISIVIAVPISWYVMQKWLQGYHYRVSIQWWWFVAAGMVAVGIALLAVSAQAIRAAVANPVKSLRSE